jgi:hypothetical protein
MKDLIIIGGGGFGRETLDVVEAINNVEPTWNFLGFIDDSEPEMEKLHRRAVKWLGGRECLENYKTASFVVGISNPKIRRELVQFAQDCGMQPATLIHPQAYIGSDVQIGPGTIVCVGASMTTNIRIGVHSQINPRVLIGHDTKVEDFVSIYPGATIGGNVIISDDVTVGANATILQGLTIGEQSFIGAGAVVTKVVPSHAIAKGVPARW